VRLSWQEVFAAGVVLTVNLQDVWKQVVTTLPRAAHFSVLRSAALGSSVSLFGLFLILQMAARNVQRGWREESASPRLLWLQRTFCTPVLWRRLFRRWMRRKLERNPIGWLEQRTWSARVVTWSWLAAMICLLSYGVAEINPYSGSGFTDIAVFMAWLLAGSMAMTAAGSFRRERETGVLELLLVSPLKVGQIIGGRLRGLWGQFLPAIVLLFGSWLYLANMRVGFGRSNADDEPLAMLFFAGAFFTLPVVGLYCSLRWNNFITAVVCTFGLGVLPFFLTALLSGLLEDYASGNSLSQGGRWQNFFGFHIEFSTVVAQVLIAGLLAFQLHQKLSTRSFVFEPG
jgi:ABC-type transport system involved in multi-copper enzyme maturation permease subunit